MGFMFFDLHVSLKKTLRVCVCVCVGGGGGGGGGGGWI